MNVLYELLESRAKASPNELGLACSATHLTFSELKRAVDNAAGKLHDLGISSGLIVATSLGDFEGWIVALALSKVGAVGLAVAPSHTLEGAGSPFWHVLVTSDPGAQSSANKLVFDRSWITIDTPHQMPAASFDSSDWVRAITTSGTTGQQKVALFNHKALASKVKDITSIWSGDRTEFNFMPISSTGGFSTALASLITGRPYLARDVIRRQLIDFIVANKVEVLSGSPDQIAGFVAANEEDLPLLAGIKTIRLAGSSPGEVFLEKLRSHVDVEIISVYGSTETGAVFSSVISSGISPEALGALRSGCDARVVDAAGVEVPEGSLGFLETKSPSMYSGYLVSATANSIQPADLWFETGDMVSANGGSFEFYGRDSNVLNVGGIKFDVSKLEDYVRGVPGISDALSFTAEDEQGREIHVMAIVSDVPQVGQKLIDTVSKRFPNIAPKMIWKTQAIQRVGLDKPARWKTRDEFYRNYLRR